MRRLLRRQSRPLDGDKLDLRRPPRILFRKLGQTQADGLAYVSPLDPRKWRWGIHIDRGLKGRRFLETMIHEIIHLVFPGMEEEHVRKLGRYLALCLWAWGVRLEERDIIALVEDQE